MQNGQRQCEGTISESSLGVIAAPNPDEGVGQRLLEYATVTVSCAASENKALVITLRLQRARSEALILPAENG